MLFHRNYEPTIYVNKFVQTKGCQQVLWLHDDERHRIEVVTPPLNALLSGIARQSTLDLERAYKDLTIYEREITMNELLEAYQDNRV
ncbi:unnamed protein product [Rotaria sp. Silwood2]|nr:unnamed protein product [Rotaria sp. Silwood2]